jgi:nitrite reductase/ring-hydroxylating ferredoxin subunit
MDRLIRIGRKLPPLDPATLPGKGRPDWVQADEAFIGRSIARARARENGGWVVVDAARHITAKPRRYDLCDREWVVWRNPDGVVVAPNDCPHMGAPLCDGRIEGGKVVCPWHGLALGARGHAGWKPAEVFDDGVLLWARLLDHEAPTDRPLISPRPERFLDGVIRMEARCDAEDMIANRMDPWHGTWFHPHSFGALTMISVDEDLLALRVAFKVLGRLAVEVDCTFHAPTGRSIVMTITGGDGVSSVVETHATPIGPGRSALIEATLAYSDRQGFPYMYAIRDLVRPLIEARAARLWVEDVAYAERRYALRNRAIAAR